MGCCPTKTRVESTRESAVGELLQRVTHISAGFLFIRMSLIITFKVYFSHIRTGILRQEKSKFGSILAFYEFHTFLQRYPRDDHHGQSRKRKEDWVKQPKIQNRPQQCLNIMGWRSPKNVAHLSFKQPNNNHPWHIFDINLRDIRRPSSSSRGWERNQKRWYWILHLHEGDHSCCGGSWTCSQAKVSHSFSFTFKRTTL